MHKFCSDMKYKHTEIDIKFWWWRFGAYIYAHIHTAWIVQQTQITLGPIQSCYVPVKPKQMLPLISLCLWKATLALRTGEKRDFKIEGSGINVLSHAASYHKQTRNNKKKHTHTHKHLLKPTLPPAWAYLCFVKSNEADIKGQCGVCITLLGLRDEMSDRNPHGGREEGEERNTQGNNWFQLGDLRRCLSWVGFGVECSIMKKSRH